MKLARPPRRRQPETIVALIDVVFFLLVFFMLIGRMDASAPFAVVPPTGNSGADMPGGGATLAVSADGALALDGTAMTREDVLARLTRVLAANPETLVRINADRGAELRHVLPLATAVEGLGVREVVLVLTPAVP